MYLFLSSTCDCENKRGTKGLQKWCWGNCRGRVILKITVQTSAQCVLLITHGLVRPPLHCVRVQVNTFFFSCAKHSDHLALSSEAPCQCRQPQAEHSARAQPLLGLHGRRRNLNFWTLSWNFMVVGSCWVVIWVGLGFFAFFLFFFLKWHIGEGSAIGYLCICLYQQKLRSFLESNLAPLLWNRESVLCINCIHQEYMQPV